MGKKMGDETKTERIAAMRDILDSGAGFTIRSLHDRFGVSRKTILRDIRELENLGVELVEEVLEDGTSRFTANAGSRRIQVKYTIEEVMALFLGRRMFDFLEKTSLEDAFANVYAKIESQLSRKKDLDNAGRLSKKLYQVHEGAKKYSVQTSQMLDTCLMALRYEKALLVKYGNSRGEQSSFTLYPYTLAAHKRGLYLVGAVPDYQGAVLKFALERIIDVQLTGEHFEYPDDYSPDLFFKDALYIDNGPPMRVELEFKPGAEAFIGIREYHPTQKIKRHKDGSIRMTLHVHPGFEVVNWVLSFGPSVRVLNPPELINAVLDHLEDTLLQYS